ncbi:MAG: YceI family protein [Acidimicrobiia bacterium]|nr:YceI family protein [Acidimicrobiia bacterium]
MNRRWLMVAGIAVVGVTALWFFFLRSDNPDRVSLDDAVEAVTGATAAGDPAGTLPDATDEPNGEVPVDAGLDGTWTVLSDENSFAGYRVGEELVGIGVTEAVGRTSAVTGTLELEGSTLTAVDIEVDMTSLRSDDTRRDGAMSRQALQTGAFPVAGFSLTQTIDLGSIPEEGQPINAVAIGDLTLHGVTQNLEIALEAQLVGDKIVVIGGAAIVYGDFEISLPSAPILVGVEEHGLIEFQLTFAR